mmetsp:Transcript_63323/g.125228  ORF Transcript_63323/g.125228 Transcript_63323/m.125228 type:complete len:201 (+) Transcript_63323:1153-1755(+)
MKTRRFDSTRPPVLDVMEDVLRNIPELLRKDAICRVGRRLEQHLNGHCATQAVGLCKHLNCFCRVATPWQRPSEGALYLHSGRCHSSSRAEHKYRGNKDQVVRECSRFSGHPLPHPVKGRHLFVLWCAAWLQEIACEEVGECRQKRRHECHIHRYCEEEANRAAKANRPHSPKREIDQRCEDKPKQCARCHDRKARRPKH